MRLYIYAAIVALIIAAAGGLYLSGQRDARQAEQLQQSEKYRNTRERIDDDLQNSRACGDGWFSRLQCATQ